MNENRNASGITGENERRQNEREPGQSLTAEVFDQTAGSLLEELCTAFGCSGHEDAVCEVVQKSLSKSLEVVSDSMRNIYAYWPMKQSREDEGKGGQDKAAGPAALKERMFDVVFDAHLDEVGFMVKSVHRNGTFSMLPIGGWNLNNAAGACFEILTEDGRIVKAIAVNRPVHYGKSSDDSSLLMMDAGCASAKECFDLGVETGCFAVPEASFSWEAHSPVIRAKALDDRIGVCAEILTLDALAQNKERPNVLGLFSTQEETGERGCSCAISYIRAKAAICFEGCPADDTFAEADEVSTSLGQGPMVRVIDRSSITDHRLISRVKRIAKDNGIPLQIAARQGGGTNAAVFQQHDIPSVVIGIPVRYAHSLCGFSNKNDLFEAVRLALLLAEDLQKNPL